MSTRDPESITGVTAEVAEAIDAASAAFAAFPAHAGERPRALPDVSVIARMANEMFKALPGGASPRAVDTAIPSASVPIAPGLALPGAPTSGLPITPGLAAFGGAPGFGTTAPLATNVVPTDPAQFGLGPQAAAYPAQASPAQFGLGPQAAAYPAQASPAQFDTSLDYGAISSFLAVPPGIVTSPLPLTAASPAAAPSFYFVDEARAPVATPRVESLERAPEIALPDLSATRGIFDPVSIRRDFPILEERVHGKPLVWLDNAATTQKPQAVIDRLAYFYAHENSNIHRGAHALAARATDAYEDARETVKRFLNAGSTREIVFVRGTTEGINLIAQTWGRKFVGEGDEIILSHLEHHSNIVPWQLLCSAMGARLRIAPVDDSGQILLQEYERLFTRRTRLVSFTHVSNALGTITPAREMIEIAHRHGARVVLDGAQSVSHLRIDVQALACDFFVFSGHKVFGPTGIGAVYGKQDVLDASPPWQGGGNMIADVTFEKTVYNPPPLRFEAGTGNIADAVGLATALEYLMSIGIENVTRHEHELLTYATKELRDIPGLKIIGTAREKAGVISFVLDGFRTEDVGKALDAEGIAVRAGHHCAQPALRRFGLESSVRPSLAVYNTCDDIDALVAAIRRIQSGRAKPTI